MGLFNRQVETTVIRYEEMNGSSVQLKRRRADMTFVVKKSHPRFLGYRPPPSGPTD
jgi:hypothetical protein